MRMEEFFAKWSGMEVEKRICRGDTPKRTGGAVRGRMGGTEKEKKKVN